MAIIKKPVKKLGVIIASIAALFVAVIVRWAGTDNLSEFGKVASDLKLVETKTTEIITASGLVHLAHGEAGGGGYDRAPIVSPSATPDNYVCVPEYSNSHPWGGDFGSSGDGG